MDLPPQSSLPNGTDPSCWIRLYRWIRWKRLFLAGMLLMGIVFSPWVVDAIVSRSTRLALLGIWNTEVHREDGSVTAWKWEFRADGTIRDYPVESAPQESTNVDDFIQWRVSSGHVILSWDHHFGRQSGLRRRVREITEFSQNLWAQTSQPLAHEDRYFIKWNGEGQVTLTLDQLLDDRGSYAGQRLQLSK